MHLSFKIPRPWFWATMISSARQRSHKSTHLAAMNTRLINSIIDRITRKFEESAAQSHRAITHNIMSLSESLTKEKIAALKAKKKAMQRNHVSAGMDLMDDDPVSQAAAVVASVRDAHRLASSKLGEYSAYGLTLNISEGDVMLMKEIGDGPK